MSQGLFGEQAASDSICITLVQSVNMLQQFVICNNLLHLYAHAMDKLHSAPSGMHGGTAVLVHMIDASLAAAAGASGAQILVNKNTFDKCCKMT